MKRILLGFVAIVGAVAAVGLGTTGAFFSDTESSTGNTFAAGAIDLLVDNESYYNGNRCTNVGSEEAPVWQWQGPNPFPVAGTPCTTSWLLDNLTGHLFFDFTDLKPDDDGEDTISLHVQNEAWACMEIALTNNDENGCNEPEGLVDNSCGDPGEGEGELAQNIEMFWWADDGDNVFEQGELGFTDGPVSLFNFAPFAIALADSENNVWGNVGQPLPVGTSYIAKAWCFGDMSLVPVVPGENDPMVAPGFLCDGLGLGNETQTDSAMVDISFYSEQARNNPSFLCEEPPEFVACEVPTLAYADNVVSSNQGVRKNGTAIAGDRSDPTKALGAPQSTGTPFDNPVPVGEFFSLGFDEGEGDGTPNEGGWIVVEFVDNIIVDGPGNDLKTWEITGGSNYPVEKVKIEVSQNSTDWFEVSSSLDRDAEADLADSGLLWAKFVRLTDVSVRAEFEDTADGYDLDAFSALNCAEPLQVID